MPTVSGEKENGRMVLGIYHHFKVRPGEVLVSNNFLAWAGRNRVQVNDVQTGLDYALEAGWIFERSNGSLELTKSGFEMM